MQIIDLLLQISESTGLFETREVTTINLAKKLNVSQQTISNSLRKLEIDGYITRKSSYAGIEIALTDFSREKLMDYKTKLIELTKTLDVIEGRVISGIGEGRFYTEIPEYKKQFKELLTFDTFPGTLNLKVDPLKRRQFFQDKKIIKIKGFQTPERTFGFIKCYLVNIKGLKGAVTIMERTFHKDDVLELISEYNLREKLNLKDGDQIKITV